MTERESDILWDSIVSIEYIGYEHVYDIEVEGTHNFIGNGIFAHNTYISDSLGIGTTDPGYKLHVNGGSLYVSGNITAGGTIGGVTQQAIQTIDLTPEFPTAVLSPTPSVGNNGAMTARFDLTNYHNYYNWIGNADNQSYDVVIRVLVPEDFGTWDNTAAVTYWANIDATPGNAGVTLKVYDTTNTLDYTDTKKTANGWNSYTVAGAANYIDGTYANSGYMTLVFTMAGDSTKNAKLGEVKLKYNRK